MFSRVSSSPSVFNSPLKIYGIGFHFFYGYINSLAALGFTSFKGIVILFRLKAHSERKAPDFSGKVSENFGEVLHHLLTVDSLNDPNISDSFEPNDMLQ